jgi:protein phosphatase
VLLCSDGLWSMLPDEEITHRLSTQTIVRAVPELIAMATTIAGPTSDNTTALAIMWQGSSEADVAGAATDDADTVISTQMLPDNLVSTTIQSTPEPETPLEIDAFNDDEIEKAIAEIRCAIEKSSQVIK